ncbi:hypothetical protein ACVIGB_000642 [Bradyrhizobium sp. USDA 4341]
MARYARAIDGGASMNKVFVNIKMIGTIGDRGDYDAVVTDNHLEDVRVMMLEDRRLLESEPHVIAKAIAERDSAVADVIAAALANGVEVRVNDKPAMDHDAYRSLVGSGLSPV